MTNDIAKGVERIAEELGIDRKRSIGEVAKELKIEPHVIRFWEENFPQIKPEIGSGKRRYYYNKQLKILKRIKKFLYEDGYTIAGLQKLLSKRKQDDSQEEDLEIISQNSSGIKILQKVQEKVTETISQIRNPKRVEETREITLDDFIDPQVEIKTGTKIDAQTRLVDFANIKVATIDPKIKKQLLQHLKNARKNLDNFKTLLKKI